MSLAQLITVDRLNDEPVVHLMCCGASEHVAGAATLDEALAALQLLGRHTTCTTWQPV